MKLLLPNFKIEETYPHFFYRGYEINKRPLPKGYVIREADPKNHTPLQVFLDGCTDEEIDDALIDLEDPDEEIRLVFHREKPIGYAGYRLWGENMGDIGILIQKEHRKKGLGIAAVAVATEACLNNKRLPFYRTSNDNKGSEAIAKNLGFQLEWITAECTCKLRE